MPSAAASEVASSSNLGTIALNQLLKGDAERTVLLLRTAVTADPNDLEARLLLIEACLQLGAGPTGQSALEEGVEVARQAAALSSDGSSSQAACVLAEAVALGSLARQQLPEQTRQKHRSEATRLLQAVESAAGPSLQALVQYNLAVLLAEAGSTEQAMGHARLALQACSGTAQVAVSVLASEAGGQQQQQRQQQLSTLCLCLLALLSSARQQQQAALRLLTAAPDPAPDAPLHVSDVLLARLKAELLHTYSGDTPAAMAALARLKMRMAEAQGKGGASLTPAQVLMMAQVWQALALLCAASKDNPEAAFCMDQAIQLCPWHARTHQALGQVHEAAGRGEAALDAYNTALALDPCDPPTLLNLGTVYQRRGTVADLALARDLLSDALRYNPTVPAAWYRLGLACRGLGHRKEAEQNLRTAVALSAQSPALPFADCPLLLRV